MLVLAQLQDHVLLLDEHLPALSEQPLIWMTIGFVGNMVDFLFH